MVTKAQMDAATRIHEKARYLRGRFLNHVAVIERDITLILTAYFRTSDTEKLSLSRKKDILVEMVVSRGWWKLAEVA